MSDLKVSTNLSEDKPLADSIGEAMDSTEKPDGPLNRETFTRAAPLPPPFPLKL